MREYNPKRWTATICWENSDGGRTEGEWEIEEISELHDIIERGEDWQAFPYISINLTYNLRPRQE